MPNTSVGPLSCKDGAQTGFAVHVTVGPHSLVLLDGDSIIIKLYPSAEDSTSARQEVVQRMSGYFATQQVTPIRLAEVELDNGEKRWAIRMLMFGNPETREDNDPRFFLVVGTDARGRLAPRLFHWPQAAMAVASDIADTIAGGVDAIKWSDLAISEYSVG